MPPVDIQQNFRDFKNEVRQLYKAELKGIFGSFATGKAHEDSDIDIFTPAALRKELKTQILGELVAV